MQSKVIVRKSNKLIFEFHYIDCNISDIELNGYYLTEEYDLLVRDEICAREDLKVFGAISRTDGPAVISLINNYRAWALNGKFYSKEVLFSLLTSEQKRETIWSLND